jgi:hypothetical protein
MHYDTAEILSDEDAFGSRHRIRDLVLLLSVFGATFAAFGLTCLIR